MASRLGLYTGGSRRRVDGRSGERSSVASAAAKQLLSRLRSTWRRSAGRPRRPAVKFGYDLQSYSQNFDDGLASSGHRFQ
ncbi:hypothetical protein SEVIR_9G227500v4 [Setaria viridis]|uniref:Uncharacterized protein n=1 Tax=Setaria viridis TaxID=4556 RepID=A0A4U6SZ69_SETVI|nr:hypothetical protein SEVIR_9G227500v2 [Setaria viridis]